MKKRMEMFESYENLKFWEVNADGNEKAKQFISTWFSDANIWKFTDLGIYKPPLNCPRDVYNLWAGFVFMWRVAALAAGIAWLRWSNVPALYS